MRNVILNNFFAPLESLEGIGQKTAKLIGQLLYKHMGVEDARLVDFLHFIPRSYIDRSFETSVQKAEPGKICTLTIRVEQIFWAPANKKTMPHRILCTDIYEAEVAGADDSDATGGAGGGCAGGAAKGKITLLYFSPHNFSSHIKWLSQEFYIGRQLVISGLVSSYNKQLTMAHPDYVLAISQKRQLPRVEPIYHGMAGLSQKTLRKTMTLALAKVPDIKEWIASEIMQSENFVSYKQALLNIHKPTALESPEKSGVNQARRRLAYDELFAHQLALGLLRTQYTADFAYNGPGPAGIGACAPGAGAAVGADGPGAGAAVGVAGIGDIDYDSMIKRLPFKLTNAQKNALEDIKRDLYHSPVSQNAMACADRHKLAHHRAAHDPAHDPGGGAARYSGRGAGGSIEGGSAGGDSGENTAQSQADQLPEVIAASVEASVVASAGASIAGASVEGGGSGFRPMMRLLQGDVGCGKTIIAALAMMHLARGGLQCALMVPTELLAKQHFSYLNDLLEPLGLAQLNIISLTGREKKAERAAKLAALANGSATICIGTHALLQPSVVFNNLSLIVIDEQHRFGVEQRMQLMLKSSVPNLLIMTATPIPRTLVLTGFGDIDISKIEEKPANRLPIKTAKLAYNKLPNLLERLTAALEQGEKAYWVCPLVEDGENSALTSATTRYESLVEHFGDKVSLIHGKTKAENKEAIMHSFAQGETQLLVATTVIEVGIDITDATIIIIEHAERFGLAQLHQLRGRVGRSSQQSACVLLYSEPLSYIAKKRLDIMCETNNGFFIAEQDLALRGEGEIFGTRQSGIPSFLMADLSSDAELLQLARDQASAANLNETRNNMTPELNNLLQLFHLEKALQTIQP